MDMQEYKQIFHSTIIPSTDSDTESQEKIARFRDAVRQLLPKKLYRFRTCSENNLHSILTDRIYFNLPKNFNDPYDCLPYIDMPRIRDMIDKFDFANEVAILKKMRQTTHVIESTFSPNVLPFAKEWHAYVKQMNEADFIELIKQAKSFVSDADLIRARLHTLADEANSDISSLFRDRAFASCFSESRDSILMWSHYADYHRGFAFEYDANDLSTHNICGSCGERNACLYKFAAVLYPIIYDDERIDVTDFVLEFMNFELHKINNEFVTSDTLLPQKTYTQKMPAWAYEKEWRLLYSCRKSQPSGNYVMIKPSAVYLGSKTSRANRDIISSLAKEKNIPIHEMQILPDRKQYKIAVK